MAADDSSKYRRPGIHMTSDDRDLESQRRRRGRISRSIRASLVDGVPVVTQTEHVEPDEIAADYDQTPVFDLVERDRPLTATEGEQLRRLIERRNEDSAERERAGLAELRALIAQPPPAAVGELGARVDALDVEVAKLSLHDTVATWVLRGVAAVAIAVGGYLVHRVLDRAELDGETKIRLQHLEDAAARELNRHSDLPALMPDAISSATTKDFP